MLLNTNRSSFFIPLCYFFSTRVKNFSFFMSWLIVYVLAVFVISLESFVLSDILNSFFLVVAVYAVYEIGYIYNDSITIEKELKPTLRLSSSYISFARDNFWFIFLFRSFLCLAVGFYSVGYNILYVYISIISLYYFYNNVRSLLNLPLHFFLVLSRFSLPILILGGWKASLFSIVFFPIPNLLERASEIRFDIKLLSFLRDRIDLFRCIYFLLLTFILFISDSPTRIVYFSIGMFFFRVLTLMGRK